MPNRVFISDDPIGFAGGDVNYAHVDSVGKPLIETDAYLFTGNNTINRFHPLGLDYLDLNVSIGWGVGITFGIMFDTAGVYPYLGGGILSPGVSLTRAPDDVPTLGWTVGLQGDTVLVDKVDTVLEMEAIGFMNMALCIQMRR